MWIFKEPLYISGIYLFDDLCEEVATWTNKSRDTLYCPVCKLVVPDEILTQAKLLNPRTYNR